MEMTVVITTVNRAESLARSLQALSLQDLPKNLFEVIIADNGSTDHTSKICDKYAAKFQNFTYLLDARPGQLVGWHRALGISQGEVCCFIDDDVCPDSGWLSGVLDAYRDQNVGLATGPIRLCYEEPPPDWVDYMKIGEPGAQTLPAFGLLDCGKTIKQIPGNFVWGTNFTIRKTCLDEIGGFHPCAMPAHLLKFHGDGEVYVGRSIVDLGKKVIYHPEISVVHHISKNKLTLNSIRSKFITSGYVRSFALLRKSGQPYILPSEAQFHEMALHYFPNPARTPKEFVQIVQDGLTQGISQHLQHFISDKNFRLWVLHENYLDLGKVYTHPELIAEVNPTNVTDWRSGQ